MIIHHATAKRAQKFGIILQAQDGEVFAHHPASNRTITHEDAKAATNLLALSTRFAVEYPSIEVADGDEGFGTYCTVGDERHTLFVIDDVLDFDADEVFACTLDAFGELDTPETDKAEESSTGSVVPAKYRILYAERGNPAHCGDWLASLLDGKFEHVVDSRLVFDHNAFETFMRVNNVPMEGKWTLLPQSGSKGWQGRYRMLGRNVMERYLAQSGVVRIGNEVLEIPADALAALREKHGKWIEKQAKKAAKASES